MTVAEVESDVDVEASERAVGTEFLLIIIIGMENGACSGEPSHVVPHEGETSHAVDVDVLELEAPEGEAEDVLVYLGLRTLVAQGY